MLLVVVHTVLGLRKIKLAINTRKYHQWQANSCNTRGNYDEEIFNILMQWIVSMEAFVSGVGSASCVVRMVDDIGIGKKWRFPGRQSEKDCAGVMPGNRGRRERGCIAGSGLQRAAQGFGAAHHFLQSCSCFRPAACF